MTGESPKPFSYHDAFARNLGWVTLAEQQALRSTRIAVAGLGGVGGSHLLALTRLGIGAFNIADFDRFDLANFNRQAGATVRSLQRPKLDVLAEMALDINPELSINRFPLGVVEGNIDEFLNDVDLYVDGLDFYALEIRRKVFARCQQLGIPAVTAAPLGMGVALLNFLPGGMSFEDYFQLEGYDPNEQSLRFLLGLSPRMLQRSYLMDRSRVDFGKKTAPSTVIGCELSAGFAATQCLKIILKRGGVIGAPRGVHFDAYRYRLLHTWRPLGNANPVQKIALAIARRQLKLPPNPVRVARSQS